MTVFTHQYKRGQKAPFCIDMAEREGFEPSIRYYRIHTFQACSFNHSDTSPDFPASYNFQLLLFPRIEHAGVLILVRSAAFLDSVRQYATRKGKPEPAVVQMIIP